jgi:hypothetical protein
MYVNDQMPLCIAAAASIYKLFGIKQAYNFMKPALGHAL